MSLTREILEWQARVRTLISEGESLFLQVEELEKQNAALQQKLREMEHGSGFEALTGLYDDGYHVCHKLFGQHREGEECLFCMDLLLHKGIRG